MQMERVRDNYNNQVKNLRDMRIYGTTQCSSMRDQYFEQVKDT